MRKLTWLFFLVLFVCPALAADPHPIEGEYYPVEGQKYPENMTNPYSHTRNVTFSGDPIEIYTQINMVTQIQLPSPPVMVIVGEPEGFVVEVVPEFKSVFVKPVAEIKMTNMIVTTEKGIYTFILKENPFKPWDIRVAVTNPYRNVKVEDSHTLVWTAYYGKRPAEFQFLPLDIRTPNYSSYIYDPVSNMGCKTDLRRVVFFPRQKQAVYWIRVTNALPPDVILSPKSLVIDERSVWMQGLEKVAVPGGEVPLLSKGNFVDMFLIARAESVPSVISVRLALKGSRLVQSEVMLQTSSAEVLPGEVPEDQRLQEMYQELLIKENIKTLEEMEESESYDDSEFTDEEIIIP